MWHKNVLLCLLRPSCQIFFFFLFKLISVGAGALQWCVSFHCAGKRTSRPCAHPCSLLASFPFRSPRVLSWAPWAVHQALLSCLIHPWCRRVSPRLPVTPIPLGIHVCSRCLCLYFCFASKITYKMAQTFQFSPDYIPVILFWVKMCRGFHLSFDSNSFSMEIIYSFCKIPYLWSLMSWDTSSKNSVVYTWN